MKKIVVNACYGGFDLSKKAMAELGIEPGDLYSVARNDPRLVSLVERLGNDANGEFSNLEVVEIPDEATAWEISEYDGLEHVIYVLDGKIQHQF